MSGRERRADRVGSSVEARSDAAARPVGAARAGVAARAADGAGSRAVGRGSRAAGPGVAVRLDRRAPGRLAAPALDPQQRAVIEHRDGHLLVLAGPGTGKTTTLAELVVSRIADPVDPIPADRILALTFGRRAARELSDRISGRLGGGAVPVVSTFHSFAYGVLRQHADPTAFASPPRLLVAAEQDARLRELLTYAIEEGRLMWPESLSRAIGTRGIAEQVRTLLARARGQGLDGKDLTRIGKREGVPVWAALGGFFEEYLATLEFEGSLDYAELILRAAVLANDPRAGRELREMFRLIVVDEYQDTDPAQVALLRGLAGGGAQVVAVGDPDQAIYGFRGADVRGILRFPGVFADPTGQPARIEVLRTTRRFPQAIAEAVSGVLGPVSLAPLPADIQRLHRTPVAAEGPARVEVRTFPTAAAEAAGVAETLLRAHAGVAGAVGDPGAAGAVGDPGAAGGASWPALPGEPGSPGGTGLPGEPREAGGPGRPGLAWSQMAVLVRNPAVHGPVLARAMRAAGIPVWLPPDETPLGDEPAVGVLLSVIGLALDPSSAPDDAGRTLLAGPLGRADTVALRALARAVLKEQRGSRGSGGSSEPGGFSEPDDSSDALLTAALARGVLPVERTDVPRSAVVAFRRVAKAVAAARDAMRAGQIVSEVLWAVWSATDWPDRLRTAALRPDGGHTAAASAHRDLDAIVALFELANRLPAQQHGVVGTAAFVEEIKALRLHQEVRGAQESDRDHVRLLSAHRAKGLEWELVVVASVQEGQWPDVRLRSDLLHVAELGPRGRIEGRNHADLLAEERRLMYVACTRARSALVVSAVAERVEGGLQASRFLAELGQDVRAMPARSASPMSAEGLIAALREAAQAPTQVGPDGSPDPEVEALRGAAIQRLAALAVRARESGPLGPLAAADPARWWGAQPLTSGGAGAGTAVPAGAGAAPGALEGSVRVEGMVRDDSRASVGSPGSDGSGTSGDGAAGPGAPRPLRLSPSAVAVLRDCPLRWFLDRRVGAGSPSGGAAVVGLVVHAVAEAIARGDVAPDEREIRPFVDEIWASVPFPAHYQRVHERQRVDEMITALLAWDASTGRSVAATELTFDLPVAAASRPVHVSGSIDRVDRAEDGSLHVVDFKTGRTAASAAATAEHPQLGIYQLAIRLGALDSTAEPVPDSEATGANGTPERLVAGSATGAAPQQTSDRGAAELLQRLPAPDPTNSTAAGGTHVRLGQAELVHLADRFASGMPKVRIQAPLDDGWTWVNDLIVDAARLADGPDYPARPNGHCKSCAFRFMCPAQSPSAGPLAANPGPAAAEPPSETERSSIPTTAESAAGERPVPAPGEPADGDAGGSSHPATTPIDPGRPARPPARKRPALPDAPVQQSLWGEDL